MAANTKGIQGMKSIVECDLRYDNTCPKTGRCFSSKTMKGIQVCLHPQGLIIQCSVQNFKKCLRFATDASTTQMYADFVKRGKLTLVSRVKSEMRQFNFFNGPYLEMRKMKQHWLSHTSLEDQKESPRLNGKRQQRSPVFQPLRDCTNMQRSVYLDEQRKRAQVRSISGKGLGHYSNTHNTTSQVSKPTNHLQDHHPKRRKKGLMTLDELKQQHKDLDTKQVRIIKAVVGRQNVFCTGSAGTGKSFILNRIVSTMQRRTKTGGIFVTATTAIAAHQISGTTLHHFAGLGSMDNGHDPQFYVEKIRRNKEALGRWLEVELLIIDEISMLDGALFTLLEAIARVLRDPTKPFGGIQLVLCGDFCQLPPVSRHHDRIHFCFQTPAWTRCIHESILLTKIYRQRKDQDYIKLLNEIRLGRCTPEILTKLQARKPAKMKEDDEELDMIELCSHNREVEKINQKRLSEIHGQATTYVAKDQGNTGLLGESLIPKNLELKPGAQVMLLKTLNQALGLVNGARGVVRGFTPTGNFPIVHFSRQNSHVMITRETSTMKVRGVVVASRTQIPLCLAWAISIHKSQGMTLMNAKLNLSRVFEYGQAYVALSRVSSMEGLILTGLITQQTFQIHPEVKTFYLNLMSPITAY